MSPDLVERRFPAMGTHAHLLAAGAEPDHLEQARARIAELESRWSRFRPGSVLTRLNRHAGQEVEVDPDTLELVALAVDGWVLSAGRFDPTVLPALVAVGYDRPFDLIDDAVAAASTVGPATPGCAELVIDPDRSTVRLPPGVQLDLGGIAKGHTADLVAGELLDAGVESAMVSLGGDLRVVGPPPEAAGWGVGIEDPDLPGHPLTNVGLPAGGLATSSIRRRSWKTASGTAHHVIDPPVGAPARAGLAAVTVIAGTAAWAEILATAALVAGPAEAGTVIAAAGAAGLLVTEAGAVRRLCGFGAYE